MTSSQTRLSPFFALCALAVVFRTQRKVFHASFSKTLDVVHNRLRMKGCNALAPALAQMTALERILLGDNQIGAKGCEALAPALAQMTALEELRLNDNWIGAKGCDAFLLVATS